MIFYKELEISDCIFEIALARIYEEAAGIILLSYLMMSLNHSNYN